MTPRSRYRSGARANVAWCVPRGLISCLAIAGVFGFGHAAKAVSPLEVKVVARSLNYVRGLESGPIKMAVLYDPADTRSVNESRLFQEHLSQLGITNLTAFPVTVAEFRADPAAYQVVFILLEQNNLCLDVYRIASANRLLTMTNREVHLNRNCSVLGFNTAGGIEIYVNEKAWKASGIQFDPVFLYMTKRL